MQSFAASHHHIFGYLVHLARSGVMLALLIAVFAPLEHFFAVRPAKLFQRGWSVNLGWYFLNSLTPIFLLGPPLALLAWAIHSVVPPEITDAAAGLPLGLRMALAMIVGEIGFYWGHRWSHEMPLLWRFHAIHHSAEHVNFLVNTRAHPVDMVFTRLCGFTLLYGTGLANPVGANPALVPALVLFVGSLWSFFIHANVRWRLGPLEEVLSSPFFHHWHHTREDHKDRNFASMLPFLDRIFGTFYRPAEWPAAYGTATPVADSLPGQLVDPFALGPSRPKAFSPSLGRR